jgi:hypothetical protein
VCLAGPAWADGKSETPSDKPEGVKNARIIQVDLDKLPLELAKQLLAELAKAEHEKGKDHSKSWHRPYDFSRMPPGIADRMFRQLPPGIAKKVVVPEGQKALGYDWSRMPPGIADRIYAKLPPGIAKKVLSQDGGEGKAKEDKKVPEQVPE